MKFSKEELEALARLPDDKLWEEVKRIAAGYGINLPQKVPSHEELEKLRSIATANKIPMGEAMMLINKYKRGAGK